MGKLSREKGRRFEQEIARELREIFGDVSRRGFQYRDGAEAGDILNPAFFIECKRRKRTNIQRALEQAIAACTDKSLFPVAITKDDRERTIVSMDLADWKELVAEWWSLRNRA